MMATKISGQLLDRPVNGGQMLLRVFVEPMMTSRWIGLDGKSEPHRCLT